MLQASRYGQLELISCHLSIYNITACQQPENFAIKFENRIGKNSLFWRQCAANAKMYESVFFRTVWVGNLPPDWVTTVQPRAVAMRINFASSLGSPSKRTSRGGVSEKDERNEVNNCPSPCLGSQGLKVVKVTCDRCTCPFWSNSLDNLFVR